MQHGQLAPRQPNLPRHINAAASTRPGYKPASSVVSACFRSPDASSPTLAAMVLWVSFRKAALMPGSWLRRLTSRRISRAVSVPVPLMQSLMRSA
jgi:hypothetical protein